MSYGDDGSIYHGFSTSKIYYDEYTTWTSGGASNDYEYYIVYDYDPYSYKPKQIVRKIKINNPHHLEDELFEI